jgi:hypothetical protein
MQEEKGEIRYPIRQHGYSCQSSSVADQVLHGQSVDELYIYMIMILGVMIKKLRNKDIKK